MFPKAILFDLDDTIISFSAGAEPTWVEVCNDFCKNNNAFSPKELLKAINEYRSWYWNDKERHRFGRNDMRFATRQIVTGALAKLGIANPEYAFEIADNYSKSRLENLELFPKARQTLKQLYKKNVRLALITNGEAYTQRYKIERFGLEKYFELILIEGEAGYGKPDMQIYRKALSSLDLTPMDVWMVGDNLEWDVAAPQKLGIFSIWVDFKMQGLSPHSVVIPDRIVNSINELL